MSSVPLASPGRWRGTAGTTGRTDPDESPQLSKGDAEDGLRQPAVARRGDAAADAEIHRDWPEAEVSNREDLVRLVVEAREASGAAEIRIGLDAEGEPVRDRVADAVGRREGAGLVAADAEVDDRIGDELP